jgi:hypothetical protein
MSEKLPTSKRPEILKWYRNLNILGAGALATCGVLAPNPALASIFYAGAAIDVAQAGGAEILRKKNKNMVRKQ